MIRSLRCVLATFGCVSKIAFALTYPCSAPNIEQNFTNIDPPGTTTGSVQSFVAQSNSITIDAAGAEGGFAGGPYAGGRGAEVVAVVDTTPGQTLCIIVGAQGGDTAGSEGGGGGASFVYAISTGTCDSNLPGVSTSGSSVLLVAAGGGGGVGSGTFAGIDFPASAGVDGSPPSGAGLAGASPGAAGNVTSAGLGGSDGNGGGGGLSGGGGGLSTDGESVQIPDGGGRALVHGASGGPHNVVLGVGVPGGFGGGGLGSLSGGGGGGYNGGGGGGASALGFGGGGGGGSYSATPPIAPYTQGGAQRGNGAVNFCYAAATTPVKLQSFDVE